METKIIQEDPWDKLRSFSKARIALGHVGGSLPLREVLDFKLAHANAKDAINSELEVEKIMAQLAVFQLPIFQVKSQIENRNQYLKRPDLGRKLNKESVQLLKGEQQKFDIVFILADGLSAEAINSHAVEVLNQILPELAANYKIGIVVATQARVALGDEIGELLNAKFTAIFIGERPGLSSPKSMGIYTTYAPKMGLTDERRNCISNIHEDGLNYSEAAEILHYLINESFRRQLSGVNLKLDLGGLDLGEYSSLPK
ncbi:ethanolamine ammonia-lyase subunit EutC [Arcticibacterium luteifluviistationis]|uniref:Ethanolamine ammonia-lyase small subunit n=1 Tax=Arcticibacterium luteifluviistationis TaxID=1784714 RepID=A0A2Z4GDX1_9BACT|nr:ethanolamine ammonia-lyase subunit EutC [Arcticibacterium luteifluviistationis]AWV99225.1 ethanolamine ammonia-lyase [Arcticibacterium luteifluviistationis]